MSILISDIKHSFRMLTKSPGFTAVAVLTLALGIGATTAVYSVVDATLLNPVPGYNSDRLIQISERMYSKRDQRPRFSGVSPPVLEGLRANEDFFSDFASWDGVIFARKTQDFSDRLSGAIVSANFFSLWDVRPMFGRTFAKDEAVPIDLNGVPEVDSVIVLSHAAATSLFSDAAEAIGKHIELSDRQFSVIGVMPPHFQFPHGYTKFWTPTEDRPFKSGRATGSDIGVLARLRPDSSERHTQALLDTVAHRLTEDHTETWWYPEEWRERPGGLGFWTRPVRLHFSDVYGFSDLRQTLLGLLAAVAFVLLIVCANLANLTLARTERRQQELAVRAAIGASPWRLIRQLLTENVLLSCMGGLSGLLVTGWGMKLLLALRSDAMPQLRAIEMNGSILGVSLLCSLATGLMFGLVPAWHAGRSSLGTALKQAGPGATASRHRGRFRGTLVVTEVALAVVLLAGAGLMIQSVIRILRVNPGYNPDNLLKVQVDLPWKKYAVPHRNEKNLLLADLHERLAALPGVLAVGVAKENFSREFEIIDSSKTVELYAHGCGIGESDLFQAIGARLLAGRHLDRRDIKDGYSFEIVRTEGISAVLINETMARTCWPGQDPLRKQFRSPNLKLKGVYEVCGVVRDIRDYSYDQGVKPIFYRPYQEFDLAGQSPAFMIRTAAGPGSLVPAIRRVLKATEPAMNTPRISVVRQTLYERTHVQRTYTRYLTIFAGVGLVLSAIGIYGVLAYSVARRSREFGIRMALGAGRRQILGRVLMEGSRWVAIGLALGVFASFCLTRLLRSQLYGVSPTDPGVFAGSVLVLVVVATLACLLPARRASRVNPMEALRCE